MTSAWDSVAFLDPRATYPGNRDAIDAWMRDLLGDTYDRPVTEHRVARKKGVIGPGDLWVPPGGWNLQSIRDLDVECHRTQIIGMGDIPYVLSLDGCFDPWFRGATISARRADGGGRMDVPHDAVIMHKTIASHNAPQCSYNRFDGRIEGVWKEAGLRSGSVGYTGAQEDHYAGDVKIFGNLNVRNEDTIDLCKYGRYCGNDSWGNNRRHHYQKTSVSYVGTGVRTHLGADVVLDNISADGCRDVFGFGGATSMMVVQSGEAENCQRFLIDHLHSAHDKTVRVSNFYMKFDLWRPGLPSPMGWTEPYEALGTWGTRGGLILDNVQFGFIPVRRASNGKLYYVENIYHDQATGQEMYTMSNVEAPKILVMGPGGVEVKTEDCSAYGYRAGMSDGKAYNELFYIRPDSAALCQHDGWKNTDFDSVLLRHYTTRLNQKAKVAA